MSYDPLMRVTAIAVKFIQGVMLNQQYAYDKVDNLLSEHTEHGNNSYSHDARYRLTQATNSMLLDSGAYGHDGFGNRKHKHGVSLSSTTVERIVRGRASYLGLGAHSKRGFNRHPLVLFT